MIKDERHVVWFSPFGERNHARTHMTATTTAPTTMLNPFAIVGDVGRFDLSRLTFADWDCLQMAGADGSTWTCLVTRSRAIRSWRMR